MPPLLELGVLANSTEGTISLGQGVPYYQPDEKYLTPVFSNFSKSEFHRYTQDPGILELREEISKKILSDFNVKVDPQTITVTNGANQAYVNSLLTITDPGDKIGLISPYYFNHKMAAIFTNVDVEEINLNNDYTLSQDNIEGAIAEGIKAIVFVNPGNPTGSVHSMEDLKLLADLTEGKDIWIISDETYEYFTYSDNHIPMSSVDALRDRLITIIRVESFAYAVSQISQTTLRSVIGEVDMDSLLAHRDRINSKLLGLLDEASDAWGVDVSKVELKDVELPENMKRAFAKQAESERERRSRVILAEGELQAAEKLAQAAELMSRTPGGITLRLLQTIQEISTENSSTVIIPFPADLTGSISKMMGGSTQPQIIPPSKEIAAKPDYQPAKSDDKPAKSDDQPIN